MSKAEYVHKTYETAYVTLEEGNYTLWELENIVASMKSLNKIMEETVEEILNDYEDKSSG